MGCSRSYNCCTDHNPLWIVIVVRLLIVLLLIVGVVAVILVVVIAWFIAKMKKNKEYGSISC